MKKEREIEERKKGWKYGEVRNGEFNEGEMEHCGPVRVCSKGLKAAVSSCNICRPYNGCFFLSFIISLTLRSDGLTSTRVIHAGCGTCVLADTP